MELNNLNNPHSFLNTANVHLNPASNEQRAAGSFRAAKKALLLPAANTVDTAAGYHPSLAVRD